MSDSNVRVTQLVAETAATEPAGARVTQLVAETAATEPAGALVSQFVVETLGWAPAAIAVSASPVMRGLTASGSLSTSSQATFTVTLSAVSIAPVSVHWATRAGTATSPADFVAASGILEIPAGSLTGTISVAVLADTQAPLDKSFSIVLSAPENVVLPAPASAVCVISTLRI